MSRNPLFYSVLRVFCLHFCIALKRPNRKFTLSLGTPIFGAKIVQTNCQTQGGKQCVLVFFAVFWAKQAPSQFFMFLLGGLFSSETPIFVVFLLLQAG